MYKISMEVYTVRYFVALLHAKQNSVKHFREVSFCSGKYDDECPTQIPILKIGMAEKEVN